MTKLTRLLYCEVWRLCSLPAKETASSPTRRSRRLSNWTRASALSLLGVTFPLYVSCTSCTMRQSHTAPARQSNNLLRAITRDRNTESRTAKKGRAVPDRQRKQGRAAWASSVLAGRIVNFHSRPVCGIVSYVPLSDAENTIPAEVTPQRFVYWARSALRDTVYDAHSRARLGFACGLWPLRCCS